MIIAFLKWLKKIKLFKIIFLFTLFISQVYAREESPSFWYSDGQSALKEALTLKQNLKRAKNIILFIGDGMGISTITAARILDGQIQGNTGEEHSLSFEKLPYVGLLKTYNTDQQVPDSAGTMTAIMTGVKTKAGFISVNQNAVRQNCESARGNYLDTLLESMEKQGYKTGIISTAKITHATPAATYAHAPERNWEADTNLPQKAVEQGCKDIAWQLVNFPYGDGIDIILGGGRSNFLTINEKDPEYPSQINGNRKDSNLISVWKNKNKKGKYVWNKEQLQAIDIKNTDKLLGLFEPEHMKYEVDRDQDLAGEPSLSEMVLIALDALKQNKKGFFLMVEAGRIDHGHHATNAHLALHDTVALSNAVEAALTKIKLEDTLIIVTADHSHVFTIAGYPSRGNPILGKVKPNLTSADDLNSKYKLANDGLPYTTLGYGNGGQELMKVFKPDCLSVHCNFHFKRKDLTNVETQHKAFTHETLIPLKQETHGGEDVAIFAGGPWSHLFHGIHEQNYIYHVIRHALQLDEQ